MDGWFCSLSFVMVLILLPAKIIVQKSKRGIIARAHLAFCASVLFLRDTAFSDCTKTEMHLPIPAFEFFVSIRVNSWFNFQT
jgi:hypothetical protein